MELSSQAIVALSGVVVSLLFAYFPGLKQWFDDLDPVHKPLWNLGVIALVTVGALAYNCRGDGACYQAGAEQAFAAFIAALLANMATFNFGVKQFKQRELEQQYFDAEGNYVDID